MKASRKKATKKHSTVIDSAERLLRQIARRKEVEKYTCGFIKSGLRPGKHRLKVMELSPTVLRLRFRGTIAVQEFKIYTSNIEATKAAILQLDP